MTSAVRIFSGVLATLALLLAAPQIHAASCTSGRPLTTAIEQRLGFLHVILYYKDSPAKAPDATVRESVKRHLPTARLVEQLTGDSLKPGELRVLSQRLPADVAPPSLQILRYFGRGMTREEAEAMSSARHAHAIVVAIPPEDFWRHFRAAHELVLEVAQQTGGLPWDTESREGFNAASWKARRVDIWKDDARVPAYHFSIHLYRDGDFLRAITVGMGKLGLPDLVVQELSQTDNNAVGTLINLLAMRLSEGPLLPKAGAFDLDVNDIQDPVYRAEVAAGFLPGATGKAPLCLYLAEPKEGDPDNLLLEIGFDRGPGPDRHARRHALLGKAYGVSKGAIVDAPRGDDELLRASAQARARLPALKAAFGKGLAPGEKLLLKYPFATDASGVEFMWVEVVRWEANGTIAGLLMNEPRAIPSLHAGQEVTIEERKVYDYIHAHPDGRRDGNETGRILQQRQAR